MSKFKSLWSMYIILCKFKSSDQKVHIYFAVNHVILIGMMGIICFCTVPILISHGTNSLQSSGFHELNRVFYQTTSNEDCLQFKSNLEEESSYWLSAFLSLFCRVNGKRYLSVQTKNWDTWLDCELVNASIFASRDSLAKAAWNGKTCRWLPFLSKRCNAFSTLLQVSICKTQRRS